MRIDTYFLSALVCLLTSSLSLLAERQPSFIEWDAACKSLPAFKKHGQNPYHTALTGNQLLEALQQCCTLLACEKRSLLGPQSNCDFYALKRVLPSNARVAIHGDIHGDIHSLNAFINSCIKQGYMKADDPFVITDRHLYILFLGDYVDRGWYGAEALYTIARLKCANPDRVLMVRGNHEDIELNTKYGFSMELDQKFQDANLLAQQCQKLYDLLPVCIYLGTDSDFVQCCHGGIELGFDPRPLLATHKKRAAQAIDHLSPEHFITPDTTHAFAALKQFFNSPKPIDTVNGFMWNDFIVDPHALLQIQLSPRDGYSGTIFQFGKTPTHRFLQTCSTQDRRLRSILRAHQHSDSQLQERMLNLDQIGHEDDRGIAKLWIESAEHARKAHLLHDIDVVTFWVTPNTGYRSNIHAYGILTLAADYQQWRLKPVILSHD